MYLYKLSLTLINTEEGHLLIENVVNIFFVTSLSISLHNLLDFYIYIYMITNRKWEYAEHKNKINKPLIAVDIEIKPGATHRKENSNVEYNLCICSFSTN